MHLYKLSGILLIVPIVDFALAVPVVVQEKRQARPDMVDIPKYQVTMLGKRVGIEEAGEALLPKVKNYFGKPEGSSAAEGSSSSAPSDAGQVSTNAPAPNPGPSTRPPYVMNKGLKGPLSSSMYPKWFQSDNIILDLHASQPIPADSGHRVVMEEPPSPTRASSTGRVSESGSESDDGLPSPTRLSSTPSEFGFESPGSPISSSVPSTEPRRASMSE